MIFLIDYFIYQNFIFIIINYFKKICSQHHIMNQKINFVFIKLKQLNSKVNTGQPNQYFFQKTLNQQ